MDWIVGIQKSLDYIESHLTESLDYENIAGRVFHLVIIFSAYSVFFAVLLLESIFVTVD